MTEPQKWVYVGKLLREWGIHGQLRAVLYNPESDFFNERQTIYLKQGDQFHSYPIEMAQPHGRFWLLKLFGINTPETAQNFRQLEIALPRSELHPLKTGEIYLSDLEGLLVLGAKGQELGRIRHFFPVGDSEVMCIRGEGGKEFLVPYLSEFVERTSVQDGVIQLKESANEFLS